MEVQPQTTKRFWKQIKKDLYMKKITRFRAYLLAVSIIIIGFSGCRSKRPQPMYGVQTVSKAEMQKQDNLSTNDKEESIKS